MCNKRNYRDTMCYLFQNRKQYHSLSDQLAMSSDSDLHFLCVLLHFLRCQITKGNLFLMIIVGVGNKKIILIKTKY